MFTVFILVELLAFDLGWLFNGANLYVFILDAFYLEA